MQARMQSIELERRFFRLKILADSQLTDSIDRDSGLATGRTVSTIRPLNRDHPVNSFRVEIGEASPLDCFGSSNSTPCRRFLAVLCAPMYVEEEPDMSRNTDLQ